VTLKRKMREAKERKLTVEEKEEAEITGVSTTSSQLRTKPGSVQAEEKRKTRAKREAHQALLHWEGAPHSVVQ
jgi:hypothetical protein